MGRPCTLSLAGRSLRSFFSRMPEVKLRAEDWGSRSVRTPGPASSRDAACRFTTSARAFSAAIWSATTRRMLSALTASR